jgi:hypothetical protein
VLDLGCCLTQLVRQTFHLKDIDGDATYSLAQILAGGESSRPHSKWFVPICTAGWCGLWIRMRRGNNAIWMPDLSVMLEPTGALPAQWPQAAAVGALSDVRVNPPMGGSTPQRHWGANWVGYTTWSLRF